MGYVIRIPIILSLFTGLTVGNARAQPADMALVAAPPAQRILGIWCARPGGDQFQRCTRLTPGWIEISREAVETVRGRCPILARSGAGQVILRCRTEFGDAITWQLTPALNGTLAVVMAVSEPTSEPPPGEPGWTRVTVLAMATDGSWGAATDVRLSSASAAANTRCRAMTVEPAGCDDHQVTVYDGWALAVRCGPETILVADRDLKEAERRARMRERDLREIYSASMPPCHRVVTIDPTGKMDASDASAEQAAAK